MLAAQVEVLRRERLANTPFVVLLDPAVPWARVLRPRPDVRPLWALGPAHRVWRDELAFLLADLVDARSGTPYWWPAERARRLGCTPARTPTVAAGVDAGLPDVHLPDGRPARIEGGPRGVMDDGPTRVHRESVELLGRLDEERDTAPVERLSREQRAAVVHRSGPARVLAPAGSGKTRVLAARLRHLVLDRGVQPELITALAYNTRAAAELRERTRDMHIDGRRPHVVTLHALGLAVCRAALGRPPNVLDHARTVAALREAAASTAAAGAAPDALLAALTEVRLGLRDPAAVEAARGDVPGLTELVPRYRSLLHARGTLDFDEQVHLAAVLLLADPALRRCVQRRTTHLLVDETQDLTPVMVLLVRLLAGPAQQLFAVGDDDQTIYGYAGADPRVLVDLPAAYAGTTSYVLTVNHRCPPAVVRAATDLLAHNRVRVPKTVRPSASRTDGGGDGLEVVACAGIDAARRTVERVRTLVDEHGPEGVAVLARVGAALLAPQVALRSAGVPLEPHVGPEVLARTGLRTALAYLRIAVRPARIDARDLADTLRRPARRLTGVVPEGRATSLAALARQVGGVDPEHRAALRRYVDDLSSLVALVRAGADTTAVLSAVRDRVGLGADLDALDRARMRPEGSAHGDDLEALLELAPLAPDPATLPRLVATQLEPPSDGGAGGGPSGSVTLSTVHRVKGREWDAVVLVGLRAGLVPHRLGDDDEEERRVLHVALTRARRQLVLVTDPVRPSPFLPELLGTMRPGHGEADAPEVLAALRDWRRRRAAVDRVPAFLVAHDRTLDELARRRPRDRAALRACHGIGETRVARYGDELLALIAASSPDMGPTLAAPEPERESREPGGTGSRGRRRARA